MCIRDRSKIAIRWGGTIDKFIGDAILVFFGDPESRGNKEDAMACVSMALEMLEKLELLREAWRERGLARSLNARMGVHSGVCTVGNFGSEDRLDYTVIGLEVRPPLCTTGPPVYINSGSCSVRHDASVLTQKRCLRLTQRKRV